MCIKSSVKGHHCGARVFGDIELHKTKVQLVYLSLLACNLHLETYFAVQTHLDLGIVYL